MRKVFAVLLAALFMAASQSAWSADLPDFSELAAKCGPAVVNINTERKASSEGADDFFGEMFRNMPPGFEKFFDQFGKHPGNRGKQNRRPMHKQKSLGSGFFVSADGYIVTNNHVVSGADTIKVTMDRNGKSTDFKAVLIGADEETDLALLKVDSPTPLPYLVFGNSDALKVGEWLLAIGNPFGLDHSVTAGILSAKGRNIRSGPFDNFLQTDASINPGNSGGPLLNLAGQVVGINTAIIASGQGIGFAIPSNMAAKIIDQIKDGKKISRGWIGVTIQDVDENTAKALGLESTSGALVGSVLANEPAARAGVKDGDVIIAVDGENIEDSAALLRAIADKHPGTNAVLTIYRDGKTQQINVTLGERKSQNASSSVGKKNHTDDSALGVSVRPLNKDERREMKIEGNGGLLITEVDPEKAAAEADLRAGDVILKANQQPVSSAAELSQIVREVGMKRGAIMLQIQRRGEIYYRSVPLAETKTDKSK